MSLYFLIGPRACGKTTVGKALARMKNCPYIDTDEELQKFLGTNIAEIVQFEGWDGFRQREHDVLCAIIQERNSDSGEDGRQPADRDTIISTGGGIILREDNRKLLRESGMTFYLDVPVDILVKRLTAHPKKEQRPSLTGKSLAEEISDVLKARLPLYRETAEFTVDGTLTPQNISRAIFDAGKNRQSRQAL